MKKWILKIFSLILAVGMISLSTGTIFADEYDPNIDGSLYITLKDGDNLLNGGSLECIPVAYVNMANPGSPEYTYTGAFQGEKMPLVNPESPDAAAELDRYALENQIAGTETEIKEGRADFGVVPHGLYLIRQKVKTEGYHAIRPFLVTVPRRDEQTGLHIYQVDARSKTEFIAEEPESSEPSSSNSSSTEQSSQTTTTSAFSNTSSSSQSSSRSSSRSDSRRPSTGAMTNTFLFALLSIGMLLLMGVFGQLIRKEKN